MMETILNVPVIVKVLGSLAVILLFTRFFRKLYLPITIGIVTLALWSGHDAESIFTITLNRLFSLDNIFLLLIIVQVIVLSSQMANAGIMKELVGMIKSRISQRASMAALPALIGFLPMPGGALFSAPLVADCDQDNQVDPLLKTQVNFWFRHVWEYCWPLYPGVLMAIELSGLDTWQFVLLQFLFSPLSILAGYLFLLRKIPTGTGVPQPSSNRQALDWPRFIKLLSPILVIIISYALIKVLLPSVAAISRFMPMSIGLIIASSILQVQHTLPLKKWEEMLFSNNVIMMCVLVMLIMVYGAFIQADLPDGMPLVEKMRSELHSVGIPTTLMIMLIPFITAFTMGIAIGFVGASFPIVISLIGKDASLATLMSGISLAYVFGYIGMMLSPVHICLVVTNEHFKTDLLHSIKQLIKPGLLVLFGGLVYFFLIRALFC